MKKFFKSCYKGLIVLASLLVLTITCMCLANGVQTEWGKVEVTMESMDTTYTASDGTLKEGHLTYKLYRPKTATETNKASAVLLLHGYQNDHETSAAYAMELARRGVVVLALDEYGHGGSDISMINRGYVNHKVTVNYGSVEVEEGKTYKEIGGQTRYKVLMNFSNLSFFDDFYSKDTDGNEIIDSSMGGIAAYAYLSQRPYVDNTKMAVSGHSMGTWASWSVAAAYSGTAIMPKAVVLQAGELFSKDAYDETAIQFNNVLLLTAKYDEFNYFRDYSKKTVDDSVIQDALSSEFLDVAEGTGEWNTTYHSFADGSARRRELVVTNHRLLTHSNKAITVTIDWLTNAIGIDTTIKSSSHVFMIKEVLVLVATLSAIASMFALMAVLLKVPFFASVNQSQVLEAKASKAKQGWKWWKGAVITIAIAGITYPFMTQLGHGLLPLPDTSIFRMTIGNGFLSWYLLLIVVMLITTLIPWFKSKKKEEQMDFVDLGLARENHAKKFDWVLAGKAGLLAIIMVVFMYVQCIIFEATALLDFRFIWPFFKGYSWERFAQLLVYLPIFLVFFVLNNSKIFAQMRSKYTSVKGAKGFFQCWWRCALCMVGGILILILIEYIPFFLGAGPGVDLLFSSTFGGPFMSLMIVFVPQVIVFSLICTHCYRKTGNVYVGAYTVALLACWIVTCGSAIL